MAKSERKSTRHFLTLATQTKQSLDGVDNAVATLKARIEGLQSRLAHAKDVNTSSDWDPSVKGVAASVLGLGSMTNLETDLVTLLAAVEAYQTAHSS